MSGTALERFTGAMSGPVARFASLGVLVLGLLMFATGGELARHATPLGSSWQSLWALATFGCLALLAVSQWGRLARLSRVLIVGAGGISLLTALQVVLLNSPPLAAGYVIASSVFMITVALALSGWLTTACFRPMMWSAMAVALASPLVLTTTVGRDNRILEMTLAFAVILIFIAIQMNVASALEFWIGVVAVLAASYTAFTDGARTASLVIVLSTIVFVLMGRPRTIPIRALILLGSGLIALVGVMRSTRISPAFNTGDETISVLGVNVSTTGRRALVTAFRDHLTSGSDAWDSVPVLLFGSGVGTSESIAQSVSGVQRLLHEPARVMADFGAVGLLLWTSLFVLLVWLAVRRLRSGSGRDAAILSIFLLVGLAAAALTENVLGYSWILFPVALALGLLLRGPDAHAIQAPRGELTQHAKTGSPDIPEGAVSSP